MNKKVTTKIKTKLKRGDKVQVIAGEDKGKQGKILAVNRESGRIIVEGVNMITKHVKAGKSRIHQQGGLIHKEGTIHVSNVMFLQDGKPTRLGVKVVKEEKGGTSKNVKYRVAKSTGETIKD